LTPIRLLLQNFFNVREKRENPSNIWPMAQRDDLNLRGTILRKDAVKIKFYVRSRIKWIIATTSQELPSTATTL
jgi:hypothetical protein